MSDFLSKVKALSGPPREGRPLRTGLMRALRRDEGLAYAEPEELNYYWRLPKELKAEVRERDEGKCRWCGATDTLENPLEYDHIHPWARGGENTAENIELLCRRHNLEKGDGVYRFGWKGRLGSPSLRAGA
jgi:5-methylcytosine-specific restriction endonuclease McrA